VINHVTLDGVMQAPGRPDEDASKHLHRRGSGALIHSLMSKGLIDEYMLMIHQSLTQSGQEAA
jgi:dihydrofolate reductase